MLYDPAAFEPLTDEPWDEARVRDRIAGLVATPTPTPRSIPTRYGPRTSGTAGTRLTR